MPNTHKCRPIKSNYIEIKNLKDIILSYDIKEKADVENEISEIKRNNLDTIIEKIGYGIYFDGVKLDHLRKLKNNVPSNAKNKLSEIKKRILLCKDYLEIFDLIKNEIENEIFGIGEMYTYDISFYIGIKLGYKPKQVFLHRSTRIGAKYMGLKINRISIPKKEFPKEFKSLETYDIENILCIYKDELKDIY